MSDAPASTSASKRRTDDDAADSDAKRRATADDDVDSDELAPIDPASVESWHDVVSRGTDAADEHAVATLERVADELVAGSLEPSPLFPRATGQQLVVVKVGVMSDDVRVPHAGAVLTLADGSAEATFNRLKSDVWRCVKGALRLGAASLVVLVGECDAPTTDSLRLLDTGSTLCRTIDEQACISSLDVEIIGVGDRPTLVAEFAKINCRSLRLHNVHVDVTLSDWWLPWTSRFVAEFSHLDVFEFQREDVVDVARLSGEGDVFAALVATTTSGPVERHCR